MKRIKVWTVDESKEGRLRARSLDEVESTETERRLEELLVATPHLLLDGLTLVGRQMTSDSGYPDLLGVDPDGRLVVLELKRAELRREAVAQVLDYAAEVHARDPDDLFTWIEQASGRGGIPEIDDFQDWHQREYPDGTANLELPPRMVLVGLGADERAKRMVNFLADAGIDIELLTFHAFRLDEQLFLARQTESVPPSAARSSGPSKADMHQTLLAYAREHRCAELLGKVADFIEDHWEESYRWPNKTSYSFSLPELTDEGRPTQRNYVTLYVDPDRQGAVLVTFRPLARDLVPELLDELVERCPQAEALEAQWVVAQLRVEPHDWPGLGDELGPLLDGMASAWKATRSRDSEGDPG